MAAVGAAILNASLCATVETSVWAHHHAGRLASRVPSQEAEQGIKYPAAEARQFINKTVAVFAAVIGCTVEVSRIVDGYALWAGDVPACCWVKL